MSVYYNEYDPDAAATLRELIADGLIADGVVDERSIELVQPSDLKGFVQVHLFAGFGIWSLAARLAGWRDDRPLWTASCPCPPFSSAGKVKACPRCRGVKPIPHVRRTGFFLCSLCGNEWLADQRHLWPEVWRLVRDERPPCIMGEQVASADGRTWLDLIRASMEILAYDAWGVDSCAAGFGAPHIRQRLYWVADDASGGRGEECSDGRGRGEGDRAQGIVSGPRGSGDLGRLADAEDADGRGRERGTQEGARPGEQRRRRLASGGPVGGMVDPKLAGLEGLSRHVDDGTEPGRIGEVEARSAPAPSAPSGLDHALGDRRRAGRDDHAQHERDELDPIGEGSRGLADAERLGREMEIFDERGGDEADRERKANLARVRLPFGGLADSHGVVAGEAGSIQSGGEQRLPSGDGSDVEAARRPGPTNGLWGNVDWLGCTDGRFRPVEPGSFPLVAARTFRNRVVALRGAGNAINLAQAVEFIRAVMPELPG